MLQTRFPEAHLRRDVIVRALSRYVATAQVHVREAPPVASGHGQEVEAGDGIACAAAIVKDAFSLGEVVDVVLHGRRADGVLIVLDGRRAHHEFHQSVELGVLPPPGRVSSYKQQQWMLATNSNSNKPQ